MPIDPPIEAITSRLGVADSDYLCLSALPDSAVHVQFLGRFQDRPVIWDATIYTLVRYHQERSPASASSAPDFFARFFMEITPATDDTYRIEVGLYLPFIDEPTIKKTIVMIRNYKRLKFGRHEWGDRLGREVQPRR